MEKMYTVKETAKELNVTEYTVRQYIKRKIIEAVKYIDTDKGSWYIPESQVEKMKRLKRKV